VITNDVSDYINLLIRIAHIIFNHPLYVQNEDKQNTKSGIAMQTAGEKGAWTLKEKWSGEAYLEIYYIVRDDSDSSFLSIKGSFVNKWNS